jgi:hypothetical protein
MSSSEELRLCCVSVDVDGIDHYHAIHGISGAEAAVTGMVHTLGVERLCAWAHELQIPLTWFVIARDTRNAQFVEHLQRAQAIGHEIANHSLDHRYDLVRLPRDQQVVQIQAAQEVLERTFGTRPIGFRAPGYTVSDSLLELLQGAGLTYDSSVFPCPPYYTAKALVLAVQRLRARRSSSILDHPRVLTAPTEPYRVGTPYTRSGQGIIELPIQVTPFFRLPFIGTTLTLGGPRWARWLARSLLGVRLINLELHAIDLLSVQDGLTELARFQSDLRQTASNKRAALSAAIQQIRDAGYRMVTLASAVRDLGL